MMNDFLTRDTTARHHRLQVFVCVLLLALTPLAAAADVDALRARYRDLTENIAANPFHAPVSVQSTETGDLMAADVYGVIEQPFAAVAEVISDPRRVCDFVSLSINIKACTYATPQVPTAMTWYMGRKDYSEPDPDQAIQFNFRVESRSNDQLHARLYASQGLLGIKDNIIDIHLAAVDGRTLVHFAASYIGSTASKMAMGTYLLTFGRNKIGFTMIPDADGKPVPVKGAQGIIERNTMRYFLALQAWLDTANLAAEQRDAARIERWYDYTERFHAQLFEVPRAEFIDNKKRERLNQQALQRDINAAAKP